jgi:hypothetical protein
LDMPRYTFTFLIDKLKKVLLKDMPMEKLPHIPYYSIICRKIDRLNIKVNNNKNHEFQGD